MSNSPSYQSDPKQRARLRWRARRGLLENDLIITRFLDRHESDLTDSEVEALTELFEMTDNELLELLLGRKELDEHMNSAIMASIVQKIRES